MAHTYFANGVLQISIYNDLAETVSVTAKVEEYFGFHEIVGDVIYGVNLAIDELLTHTITNGYDDDGDHLIEVLVKIHKETIFVVIVEDGKPLDLEVSKNLSSNGDDIEEHLLEEHLGLFLVHQVMNEVRYQRVEGCNVVTLSKDISTGVLATT